MKAKINKTKLKLLHVNQQKHQVNKVYTDL